MALKGLSIQGIKSFFQYVDVVNFEESVNPGNIIRKVAPDAFGQRAVEDGKGVLASLVVHPVRIVVPLTKPKAGA